VIALATFEILYSQEDLNLRSSAALGKFRQICNVITEVQRKSFMSDKVQWRIKQNLNIKATSSINKYRLQ
jgi:hypothetical protein